MAKTALVRQYADKLADRIKSEGYRAMELIHRDELGANNPRVSGRKVARKVRRQLRHHERPVHVEYVKRLQCFLVADVLFVKSMGTRARIT